MNALDEAALQAALDREAIHTVLMRYCRGVDRLDRDLIASVYHPDAYDHHGPSNMLGVKYADYLVVRLAELFDASQHRIANLSIDLRGDVAWTESYLHSFMNHADRIDEFVGRYIDRFERRDGEWKIGERWVVADFTRAMPVASRYASEGYFLKGRRDRQDQSYARAG